MIFVSSEKCVCIFKTPSRRLQSSLTLTGEARCPSAHDISRRFRLFTCESHLSCNLYPHVKHLKEQPQGRNRRWTLPPLTLPASSPAFRANEGASPALARCQRSLIELYSLALNRSRWPSLSIRLHVKHVNAGSRTWLFIRPSLQAEDSPGCIQADSELNDEMNLFIFTF